ncbi:uncharacterized protein LOC128813807 [Vidua macroura]|uniref:uncharacterized protein LOC128813807 n=1 Tax=Vidua macroura TaxID=187451 RepID=UPI0023A8EAA8|nr:uncharacterized protein LOC128813807 [Vidua macroura]
MTPRPKVYRSQEALSYPDIGGVLEFTCLQQLESTGNAGPCKGHRHTVNPCTKIRLTCNSFSILIMQLITLCESFRKEGVVWGGCNNSVATWTLHPGKGLLEKFSSASLPTHAAWTFWVLGEGSESIPLPCWHTEQRADLAPALFLTGAAAPGARPQVSYKEGQVLSFLVRCDEVKQLPGRGDVTTETRGGLRKRHVPASVSQSLGKMLKVQDQ